MDPEKLFVAWTRGEATTADVLDPGWDLWSVAEVDLHELRARYGTIPLDSVEPATGREIVAAADADPTAD